MISLEYHEVLSAAFGHQAEANKHNAIEKYKGKYVLVVDGSVPLKDNGIYCMIAGEPIADHPPGSGGRRNYCHRLLCRLGGNGCRR